MANETFESWRQKRVASSKKVAQEEVEEVKTDDLETVEVPGEVEEVKVDEAVSPVEETLELPAPELTKLTVSITSADDLELAKEAIKDALDDASVEFSFEENGEEEVEEPGEETETEEKAEEVEAEEPKEEVEEEEEVVESPTQEVEAKCDEFKKYAKEREENRKAVLAQRIESMRKGTDYNEVMSRSSLAPQKKVASRIASSLKQGNKYLVGNSVIEILGIDSNNDLVEYYDGKKDRTISASLSEIEKKIVNAENERVAKEKEKATK